MVAFVVVPISRQITETCNLSGTTQFIVTYLVPFNRWQYVYCFNKDLNVVCFILFDLTVKKVLKRLKKSTFQLKNLVATLLALNINFSDF